MKLAPRVSPLAHSGKKPTTIANRYIDAAISAIRRNNGSAWWVPDDYGMVLGPELVTNGDFSNGTTGWAATNGTLAATSGAARVTSTATAQDCRLFSTALSLTVGKQYIAKAVIVASTSPNAAKVSIGTGGGFSTVASSAGAVGASAQSVIFTATAATMYVWTAVAQDTGAYFDSDNISVREVLSASIYTDSTGTTPVSAVGDVLGLLTDRSYGAGNTSANLLTAPTDLMNAAWAVSSGSKSSVTGGTRFTVDTANAIHRVRQAYPSLAGEIGIITVKVKPDGVRYLYINGQEGWGIQLCLDMQTGAVTKSTATSSTTPVLDADGFWTVECRSVAASSRPAAAVWLQANNAFVAADATYLGNGTDGFIVKSCTFQRVLGNHATQATTANKPIITQVPRRLGPELVVNGDFALGTANWTFANGAAVSAGQLSLPNANATAISSVNGQAGKNYWFSFDYISGSGTQFINVQAGSAVFGVATSTTARRYAVPVTAGVTNAIKIWQDGGAAGSAVIDNISVREVLEWSNAIKFDGSNDSLSLNGPTLTSAATYIFSGTCSNLTSYPVLLGQAVGGLQVMLNANGSVTVSKVSAGMDISSSVGVVTSGVPFVLSVAIVAGGTSRIFVNGVLVGSGTQISSALSASATYLGFNGTSGFLAGSVAFENLIPAAISDADRKTIERFAAYLAGATYLG